MLKMFGAPLMANCEIPSDIWQTRWARTSRLTRKQYDLPSGTIGREFVNSLADEIDSLTNQQFTSERLIIFCALILQRDSQIRKAAEIRQVLKRRLQMWREGHFDVLLHEAERCDSYYHFPDRHRSKKLKTDHVTKIFARLMLQGRVREAMRWISEEGKGGVLAPNHVLESGMTVLEVLQDKHPQPQPLCLDRCISYDAAPMPPLVDFDITR
jgi:hypothetical protein